MTPRKTFVGRGILTIFVASYRFIPVWWTYLIMEAFSFIPFLGIWTISNHTGIGDTNVHASRIYILK